MSDDVSGMYSPVPNALASSVFGRAWWVTISTRQFKQGTNQVEYQEQISFGQKTWEPESLRITFDATYVRMPENWWSAVIVIYNMNAPTLQKVILYGYQIKLEAGYQNSNLFGTIWEGTILQPVWEQENGVDWKLTLNCIVGPIESANNFVADTAPGGISQREMLANMLLKSRYPLQSNFSLDDNLKVSRATTYFGQPNDVLQAVADTNKMILWYSDMMANIGKLDNDPKLPTWKYTAGSGIIGTPEQTQEGVDVRVLLDPRLVLGGQIWLDQDLIIKRNLYTIGNVPNILAQSGRYFIGKIRHYGDSRGNDWYTDVTGVNYTSILSLFTDSWR